ncbi:MAG: hypothetical protein Q4D56_08175 [Bacteroides sp.]|nr:hypothetical protein [Bacteroides sp.]
MQYIIIILLLLCGCAGCQDSIRIAAWTDDEAAIFPDYKGVTIPPNVAPINFTLSADSLTDGERGEAALLIVGGDDTLSLRAKGDDFDIPLTVWRKLLEGHRGDSLCLIVCLRQAAGDWKACRPFSVHVATDDIDSYLVYRLIPPGYGLWNEMGIYQRHLETFDETAIYENRMGQGNCVNCHSFCRQSPDEMLFHLRVNQAGTYIFRDGKREKLSTKTDHTVSDFVYPAWHPSGRFVAFSVNKTFQVFHTKSPNRIEVCDEASDVVVYDVLRHEVLTTSLLYGDRSFETFPVFSSDGCTLYFCTAPADSMPQHYNRVKYSLCSIAFDPDTHSFGTAIDTLYDAVRHDKSVSFPRVSPDGRLLAFTLSNYGNFSIWHKEADLYFLNLETKQVVPLTEANSDDVESYHSWSSNGRWLAFSSRRDDGLYTRPYFAYVARDGTVRKPFLLPQRRPKAYYEAQMNSYNIPELVKGKIRLTPHEVSAFAQTEAVPIVWQQ